MTKKVIDTNINKILKEGDVLESLIYKNGQELRTLYNIFIRFITEEYIHIDVDDNFTRIKINDIISWS